MSFKWPSKDSDERLDYSLDWSRFLRTGESISSVVWYIEDSDGVKQEFPTLETVNTLTNYSNSASSTVTTITLSNGTNNTTYKLFCDITTNTGFTAERSVTLRVRER